MSKWLLRHELRALVFAREQIDILQLKGNPCRTALADGLAIMQAAMHTFLLEHDRDATSARRHRETVEDEIARHGAVAVAVVKRKKL